MWTFVTKILQALLSFVGVAVNQIKAAWVQARALILALGALAAKYWGARLAWRIGIAVLFVGLMRTATSSLLSWVVPSLGSLLSLFAPSSVTTSHEGIFHAFWDGGLNLQAFFVVLRQVVADLTTAWTCRRLWSIFLVRRIVNPPV